MSYSQFQLTEQNGPFKTVTVEKPTPSESEVCIRTKAIGLNPLDYKQRQYGIMIQSWPTVLGVDAAGVVESVGSSVKQFKAGDEVYMVCGHTPRDAAHQEIITVPAYQVAKKPAPVSFEQAASLPVCYLTAASLVTVGLDVPLPHLNPEGTSSLKTILVVGGSSAVGASVIQLLRLALPSATILTTSSVTHHSRLQSLGATKCFERSAQDDISVIKAATSDGNGIDAIIDAVAVADKEPSIFKALSSSGPRLYAYPMAGAPIEVPEGINGKVIFGRQIFDTKGGSESIPALTTLLENGKFKVPTKVISVGTGLESIPAALDKLSAGTSGTKFAITL